MWARRNSLHAGILCHNALFQKRGTRPLALGTRSETERRHMQIVLTLFDTLYYNVSRSQSYTRAKARETGAGSASVA